MFTGIDPMAEKYYGISPYAYCAGNPVNYVDPDGRVPRVYVYHGIPGHAFVTAGEGNKTVVYSYGRYGALDPSCGVNLGPATLTGEGVLYKLEGNDASDYLSNNVLAIERFDIYQINAVDDADVQQYYDDLFEQGRPSAKKNLKYGDENAKVVDTYDLLENNCVTTTKNGINAKENIIDTDRISPFGLSRFLETESRSGVEIIKIENPKQFVKYLINQLNQNIDDEK